MKKIFSLIFVLLLGVSVMLSGCAILPAQMDAENLMAGVKTEDWPKTPDLPDQKALQGMRGFAADLLLASLGNKGNIMISPVSVYLALAMTLNGADHETREAMLNVLAEKDITVEMIDQASRDLIILLSRDSAKTKISIANSIWFNESFQPDQLFLQTNADYFRAGARKLDFSDEKSPAIINGWVEQETNGLIKKIIEKISPSTVMFLINTVYFKSDWQVPFLQQETRKMNFNAASGPLMTDFMHRTDKMNFFSGDGVIGVALPYEDQQFSYFAMMTEDQSDPRVWLANQNKDQLFTGIANLMAQKANFTVDLLLPKYEAEYEDSLLNELDALGMGIAFDGGRADFSLLNAAHAKGLFISEVKHKTFIRVDEKGTEAAAATSVAIDESAIMADKELIFDRPFIYGIMDVKTGIPLFIGVLESPAK